MTHCIGFLELNSIARGVAAADAMLKAANLRLLYARPNCPGKYNILVSGDVAAVEAGMAAGTRVAGGALLEELLIPRLHPQVIQAIHAATPPETSGALGVMEFFTITGAVFAGDAAVKAAAVDLLDIRLGTGLGGKSYVVVTGETAAVEQAVAAGTSGADERGTLVASVVLPNPVPELYGSLL